MAYFLRAFDIFVTMCYLFLISEASHSVLEGYSGLGLIPLETNVQVKDTDGTRIQCSLSGSTYVEITWKARNPQTFNLEQYFQWSTSTVALGGSSISIGALSFKDSLSDDDKRDAGGIIYAVGSHADDPSTTTACDDVSLTIVWTPEKPSLSINKNPFVLGEDSTAQLTCQPTDKGNPEGQVRWVKNGNLQSGSEYNTEMISIPVTTDMNGDKWQCFYDNTAGNGNYSDEVMINVNWKPEKPSLSINKNPFVIGEDSTAQLTCEPTDKGNPEGQVRWVKNGILQSGSEYNRDMISKPVTKDINNDRWQCYYYSTVGDGDYSDEIMIKVNWNVSSDNVILNGPQGNVTVGDAVTLSLSLNDPGNPPAMPSWYHNGTKKDGKMFSDFVVTFENIELSDSGTWACSASNGFSGTDKFTYTLRVMPKPPQDGLPIWVYIIIAVVAAIIVIVIIVIIVVFTKKKNTKKSDTVVGEHANDQYAYNNKSFDAKTGTGHYDASKTNAGAEDPVYSAVSKGKPLAPIADGAVYSQVDLSKKTSRKSMKGLPMSKKAIDRIIFHKKDGYVNMTFQVRKKFDGDIEISVCRVGDQSCTSKVSKQHDGASKDVVMVLPIEDSSPDNYSIHIKFIERGQVTQTVDLTYPYNKNAVNVTVLNNVYGTNVSPSYADVEVEGVPPRPSRQGYPAEGVTYAVMDWDRSQVPGRPPRLSARSPAQEHVVYADVRPGGNVY